MRRLFNAIAIATMVAVNCASAAELRSTAVDEVLNLEPGQVLSFEFPESVAKIGTPVEGVAHITAQTDRAFSITGIAPGEAFVMAQDEDGKIIRRLKVVVSIPGNIVKVYGSDKDMPDYAAVTLRCGKSNCVRIDPAPAPRESITVNEHVVSRRLPQ